MSFRVMAVPVTAIHAFDGPPEQVTNKSGGDE
jgi:hypothetical protein